MKTCSKCGDEKDESNFHKNSASKDGLRPDCTQCKKLQYKEWAPNFASKQCNHCGYEKTASEFYPKSACCKICRDLKTNMRAKALQFKAESSESAKKILLASIEKMRATNAKWRIANKEKVRAKVYQWRKDNPDAYHSINAKSRKKNFARVMVSNGQRRAIEKSATPSWANKKTMASFYKTARGLNMLFGEWHHVDHIVPLNHKLVCGLHCEANMQILTAAENFLKNNRFWPDMPVDEAKT